MSLQIEAWSTNDVKTGNMYFLVQILKKSCLFLVAIFAMYYYIVNITVEGIVQLYEEHTYAMSKQDFNTTCTKTMQLLFKIHSMNQWR